MESQEKSGKRGEIKSLTGLRGLAACLVVLYHSNPWRHITLGPVNTFCKHGYLAVDLFFILSGFVMAMTYAEQFRSNPSVKTYWTFFLMRIGRIYPLYLTITVICWAVAHVGRLEISLRTTVSNGLLVQGWGIAPSLDGAAWSISTEFAAYLLFPCLLYVLIFGRRRTACIFAAAAASMLVFIAFDSSSAFNQISRSGPLDVYGVTVYPLLRCLAGFMLGLFAWRVATIPVVIRLSEHPLIGTGIALSVIFSMTVPAADILTVFLFVPLVIALTTDTSAVARFVGSRVPHQLGLISYSIYLVHGPIFNNFEHPLAKALSNLHVPHASFMAGALIILLVLSVSIVTYRSIEKPGRDLVRTMIRRWRDVRNIQVSESIALGG